MARWPKKEPDAVPETQITIQVTRDPKGWNLHIVEDNWTAKGLEAFSLEDMVIGELDHLMINHRRRGKQRGVR